MQITREADYAIRCVLYLAAHRHETVAVGEIAEAQYIPKTFTAKILQKLVRAGIVASARGKKGGFTLARAPSMISLLDVIETIQGPIPLNMCVIDRKSCERTDYCTVHPVWVELRADFVRKLRSIRFSRLVKEGKGSGRR